jgi:hypothetical protein
VAVFAWEFALPPAIALIFGPGAAAWNGAYPWAAGRQAEVFAFVGAEVVRQKAAGYFTEVDLDAGTMSVLRKRARRPRGTRAGSRGTKSAVGRSPAHARFLSSIVPVWERWRDDQRYDVAAIAEMSPRERAELVPMLAGRDVTWREVEALAAIDTPAARAAVEAASKHHLSIDTRLAAAEAMQRAASMADFGLFLARQIRHLDRPANGLARALLLAERHPTEAVKQALLWASYNQTECAPHCARLLLILTGAGKEPFDPPTQEMLRQLGLHNSSFARKAAFDRLCRLVNMQLDHEAAG